ncbi:MAG: pirin family protein, partial [Bacilli bacterium]
MLKKYLFEEMGKSNLGWLDSHFHFSFSDYYNPRRMGYGKLRVVNDDLIKPETGFDTHHHRDMEIVSYVVNGVLSHQDSMGNKRSIKRGEVQYMSAGTGIYHSEYNLGSDVLRILQIWVLPDAKNHIPHYGEYLFNWDDRINNWLQIVSSYDGKALVKIHQDFNIYVSYLTKDNTFKLKEAYQGYLICIEGDVVINNIQLKHGDALEFDESINLNISEF